MIDRFGSYVALAVQWVLMLALALFSIRVTNAEGLIVLMVLFSMVTPLQVAGDTILWKGMDKADTGSYTSTVALIRNFFTGTVGSDEATKTRSWVKLWKFVWQVRTTSLECWPRGISAPRCAVYFAGKRTCA
jgi:hypothetical protein